MSGRSNALNQLVEKYDCHTFAEIGCRECSTSYNVYKGGNINEIILVDLDDRVLRKDLISKMPATFYHMPSVDAIDKVLDDYIDLVYIDADHGYDSVLADIKAWLPKVKKGKIICGHDYSKTIHPGVVKAVDESFDADEINLIPDTDFNDVYVWWVRV